MSDEIQKLIPAFRTDVGREMLKFKYSGNVFDFSRSVNRQRARYNQKIQHLRIENQGRDQIVAECDACEQHIAKIAALTIEAAKSGRVDVPD